MFVTMYPWHAISDAIAVPNIKGAAWDAMSKPVPIARIPPATSRILCIVEEALDPSAITMKPPFIISPEAAAIGPPQAMQLNIAPQPIKIVSLSILISLNLCFNFKVVSFNKI